MALAFEGLEISEEVQAKLNQQFTDQTEGISKRNQELLWEKKTAQAKAAQIEADRDADVLKAAEDAVDAAAGDKEAYRKAKDEQFIVIAELKKKLETQEQVFAEKEISAMLSKTVLDLVRLHAVPNDPAISDFMVKTYGKGLEVRDGKVRPIDQTKDMKEYAAAINNMPEHVGYMAGGKGTGGGAAGNPTGRGNNLSTKQIASMSSVEKLQYARDNGLA